MSTARELSPDRIGRLIDPELVAGLSTTLPPHLPDGPLTAELVRALDERLRGEPPVETAEVVQVPGGDLDLRLHQKPGDATILWIHGGGLFLGSAARDDELCSALADEQGATVAAVDYRLAPEFPYPAALDDCVAALRWLGDHFARIVVVGESAGGGLAACTSLLVRDQRGPRIAGQVLHYPMLDDRGETRSARLLAETPVWNRRLNELGWRSYLAANTADRYAAAARAEDLAGLPPTYLEVGELDLLRDEVIAFAAALVAAGVTVDLHLDAGTVHGFDRVAPDAAISCIAAKRRSRFIRSRLAEGERQ
jgi:acetyl esterase/lipase